MSQSVAPQKVQCPGCQAGFRVKAELAGKKVKCPKCQTTFVVPGLQDSGSPKAADTTQPAANAGEQQKICGYCKQSVPIQGYEYHFGQHMTVMGLTGRMPGMDMESQYKGDISGQPRFYAHEKCGQVSGMAENIVRTYLANPWFYGYSTFCIGCRKTVPNTECRWIETGEGVQDHVRRLQAAHPNATALKRKTVITTVAVAAIGGLILALILGWVTSFFTTGLIAWIVFAVVLFGGTAALTGLLFSIRGGI